MILLYPFQRHLLHFPCFTAEKTWNHRCSWVCAVKSSRSHKIFCETYRPSNVIIEWWRGIGHILDAIQCHFSQGSIFWSTIWLWFPTGIGQEGTRRCFFDSLSRKQKSIFHKKPKLQFKRDWCVLLHVCLVVVFHRPGNIRKAPDHVNIDFLLRIINTDVSSWHVSPKCVCFLGSACELHMYLPTGFPYLRFHISDEPGWSCQLSYACFKD